MITGATIFTGFDGAGVGMAAAGIDMRWGIELDDKIAAVARMNGHHVITANILDCDPHNFEPVDCFHASPPCTRASLANSTAELNEDGLKECQLDIDLAMKTVEFIEILNPRIVTIENVWAYRKFQAFRGGKKCEGILPSLERLGYWVSLVHVNSADFGVPQTRKRLILRAVRGGWVPQLPEPEPWIGWYAAIEDLIPTLPESQFAPWQLERLPEELKTSIFSQDYGSPNTVEDRKLNIKQLDEPLFTLKAQDRPIRAFLVNTNQSGDDGDNIRVAENNRPAFTTTPSADGRLRAFLISPVDGLSRDGSEPAQTVVSNPKTVEPRAFLVHPTDQRTMPVVDRDEPTFTVMSANGNGNMPRAFLVNGALSTSGDSKILQINPDSSPSGTIVSSYSSAKDTRAWLSQGHVVKMTPRALARFQSFTDTYQLSGNNSLDCKGIGNAVPPLLMEKIYRQLLPEKE
jgi:DNA (cytosine-5)-methyltransferase 1